MQKTASAPATLSLVATAFDHNAMMYQIALLRDLAEGDLTTEDNVVLMENTILRLTDQICLVRAELSPTT